MLVGTKFLSVLDLNRFSWRKKDKWQIALFSVLTPFRCNVMPFDFKGVPAPFQADITTFFQPVRGHAVTVYLENVLIHVDLLTRVKVVQQFIRSCNLSHAPQMQAR